jgi:GNAT superfamily N-acetyltransferase
MEIRRVGPYGLGEFPCRADSVTLRIPAAFGSTYEDWVELISMWVAPSVRGGGVALQLIDAVTLWAAEQGRMTYLMVRSDNLRAPRAYERAGLVDTGIPGGWPVGEPLEHRMELRT